MADASAWNRGPLYDINPGMVRRKPETWGDVAASFGSHLANLPVEMIKGAWDAVTLPGRAYRGEVPTNAMMPEALNFAGNVALGGYMSPKPAGALGMSGGGKGITAYHGSPHEFDRFDMGKIGSGEGAQAFGHGLYFAENEGVARSYRDHLAWKGDAGQRAARILDKHGGDRKAAAEYIRSQNPKDAKLREEFNRMANMIESGQETLPGHMYEVRINAEPEQFLDWDKPLSQQSASVQDAVNRVGRNVEPYGLDRITNDMKPIEMHKLLQDQKGSKALKDAGVAGIRYLDQGSRAAGEGSRNYVVFDDKIVEIMRKYGLLGMFGAGAAASSGDAEAGQ